MTAAPFKLRSPHAVLSCALLTQSALLTACASSTPRAAGPFAGDANNAVYTVEGSSVALRNGSAASGGGEVSLTQAGLELDLNGDGVTDKVVVLAKSGDTSTTMYLAALVSGEGKYSSVPGVPLGHEIVVRTLSTGERDTIRVDLLVPDPKAEDKTRPSKKVTKQFEFTSGALRDVTPEE